MTVNQSLFGQPAIYNAASVTLADGQATSLQVDANGYLRVSVSGGASDDVHQEDTQHTSGDYGSLGLAVRNDAGGSMVGTDGDYAPVQVDSNGLLRVTVDNAVGAGVYVRPGTSATWDVSDRAARDLGKVDIAAFDAALYTGDNVIGRVKITDGTEVAAVNANNRLEISIDEDNVGLGRNETITETTATQDLSAAALSATTSIGADFRLNYITLHFSAATTETVTITVDSLTGANYDTILVSESLAAATDMTWVPDGALDFKSGNEIKVECTDNGGANTVYVVVSTEAR